LPEIRAKVRFDRFVNSFIKVSAVWPNDKTMSDQQRKKNKDVGDSV